MHVFLNFGSSRSVVTCDLQDLLRHCVVYMIIVADKINKLEFSKIVALYADDLEESRKRKYGRLSEYEGKNCAEQDYYLYLKDVFFTEMKGKLYILEENGLYISAACFEPFKDGLLLNSLVTDIDFRKKGYAQQLLRAAFENFKDVSLYSHVHIRNIASIHLHEKLGFDILHQYAHMLDGSVRSDHYTYIKNL